jgi:hypothetical protein
MLTPEFARFVEGLFPAVDPAEAKKVIAALQKAPPTGREFFAHRLPEKLSQGDIIEPITFIIQDNTGEFGQRVGAGMVLSNSCDIDEDDRVLVAEIQPFELFRNHSARSSIQSNTFYRTLYLANTPHNGDIVVDLAQVQTLRKDLLLSSIGRGDVNRRASFTNLGYYLFIAKLTIHLLRPQSAEEVRNSAPRPRRRDRVRNLLIQLFS